ncbi:hypothetical protein F2Q69_00053963 [Brassica cretica]|uniref:Uncharacterized protein n=1 Tax=Brassica cretica TaxID=69181 RepID=A0A8S9MWD8_BRACR|nr:hypothetical protein F2Q69_00053963 [Brassica cretica]
MRRLRNRRASLSVAQSHHSSTRLTFAWEGEILGEGDVKPKPRAVIVKVLSYIWKLENLDLTEPSVLKVDSHHHHPAMSLAAPP